MPLARKAPGHAAANPAAGRRAGWRCDGVLFDYGGTLVTFTYPTEQLLEVIRRFGLRIQAELGSPAPAAEVILRNVLIPLEDWIGSLSESEVHYFDVYRDAWHSAGLKLGDGLLYEILDAEQLCWDRSVKVEPEALPLLEWLGARGIKRGICSNAPFPPEMLRRQVASNGISAKVDGLVFSSEVGRRKPAPEIYWAALNAIGTQPDRTLFVGNSVREDHDGPTALGMRAVILKPNSETAIPVGVPTLSSIGDLAGLV